MTEQSDKADVSEGKSVDESVTITGNASVTVEETAAFSAANIRGKLEDGEYPLALILTSTRLETS